MKKFIFVYKNIISIEDMKKIIKNKQYGQIDPTNWSEEEVFKYWEENKIAHWFYKVEMKEVRE